MRNVLLAALLGLLGFICLIAIGKDLMVISVAVGWYLIAIYASVRLVKLRGERKG